MKRTDVLAWMRIAGYHDDKRAFTRLLIENRISRKAADEAWQQGRQQKQAGMRCTCYDCTKHPKREAPRQREAASTPLDSGSR